MQDDDEPLSVELLELADTRPKMAKLPFLGEIPVQACGLIVVVFGSLMGITGNPILPIVSAIPVWWGIAKLIALDYHIFTRLSCYFATSFGSWDATTEGGASATPGLPEGGLLVSLGVRRPDVRGCI